MWADRTFHWSLHLPEINVPPHFCLDAKFGIKLDAIRPLVRLFSTSIAINKQKHENNKGQRKWKWPLRTESAHLPQSHSAIPMQKHIICSFSTETWRKASMFHCQTPQAPRASKTSRGTTECSIIQAFIIPEDDNFQPFSSLIIHRQLIFVHRTWHPTQTQNTRAISTMAKAPPLHFFVSDLPLCLQHTKNIPVHKIWNCTFQRHCNELGVLGAEQQWEAPRST